MQEAKDFSLCGGGCVNGSGRICLVACLLAVVEEDCLGVVVFMVGDIFESVGGFVLVEVEVERLRRWFDSSWRCC